MNRPTLRSPIKSKPLRMPGQSLQERIDDVLWDGFIPYYSFALAMLVLAGFEWMAVWRHLPRQPWLYTGMAILAIVIAGYRFYRLRKHVAPLKLGRDGELAVGQFLERLRADHAQVFHDVPGDGFNIDHVVLSPRGFYTIETKTHSKPARGSPRIQLKPEGVLVDGHRPDRDPLVQAKASARWLGQLLEESTGKHFPVRGVVLYPGWMIDEMDEAWLASSVLPWVLEPKVLPAFLRRAPVRILDSDVKLAAFHLSRYIRA